MKPFTVREIAYLKSLHRRLTVAHVTHDKIARRVKVSRAHVSHVLAGRFRSARVLAAAEEELARA